MLDLIAIKSAATSRWTDILSRIGGIDPQVLDGKHHPCPKCGGIDRFRMLDAELGAVMCNQCFAKKNGDGIAAVMWLTGLSFRDAIARIAEQLGMDATAAKQADVVAEMAWRKNVNIESLRAFGALEGNRGGVSVCRVPMWDANRIVVGQFDLAPTQELDKGKMTHGSRHGLFMAEWPKEGDTVAVVEGVKDAAALHAMGVKAVGLPTCRMDAQFARVFRGCRVVVVPDRDDAGISGADETGARLFGVAASVKIAELPAEYQAIGGADVRDVLRQRNGKQKVLDAIEHAREWRLGVRKAKFESLPEAVVRYLTSDDPSESLMHLGLPGIDKALGGGVQVGEMIIIAGRPSHGKTVVAMQALDNLAKEVGVLMISEEMSLPALAQRAATRITTAGKHDQAAVEDVVRHYSARKECLVMESCATVQAAVAAIEHAKTDHGIGAVVVDYVQLLRGRGNSRYEQVSDVSTQLKQAAVKYDVALLAVCQLNRAVESRHNTNSKTTSTPRLSDLRDSGQLEQDADVVLLVEWLYRTSPQAHHKGEYRILVAKNRNRPIVQSIIDCVFKPERQSLYEKEWRNYSESEQSTHAEFDQFR